MSDTHEQELQKFCRVCGRKLNKGYKHKCSNSGTLLQALGVDVSGDESRVHPPFYCHSCHSTAKRLQKVRGAESSLRVHTWSAHGDGCEVCTMTSVLHLGGRKMKEPVKRGRPSKTSMKGIANTIASDAPKTWRMTAPLSLSRFLPPSTNLNLSDFKCVICNNIVDRPVTTPCRKLVCAECICDRIRTAEDGEILCPSCSEMHPVTATTFTTASDVVLKVLGGLLLHCDQPACSAVVSLEHLRDHVQSGCTTNTSPAFSPSKLTVGQVLSCPLESVPTCTEQRAAASVIQRLLHVPKEQATPGSVIKLTTDNSVRFTNIQNHHLIKFPC